MAKKKVLVKDTDPIAKEYAPMDFVYLGRRMVTSGDYGHEIALVNPSDRTIGDRRVFPHGKEWARRSIGSLYRGASFKTTGALGLNLAKFAGSFTATDAEQREWRAADEAAEAEIRMGEIEEKLRKSHAFESILLPLREQYQSYNARFDSVGASCFREAVLRALIQPLREREKK